MNRLNRKNSNSLLLALYCGLVLWAVGAVMRESDQASLLSGSVQLARDGEFAGVDYYNYSRQFGSYWVIGATCKLLGLEKIGIEPAKVVRSSNFMASLLFLSGVFVLLRKCGPSDWWDWVLVGAVLLCPVVLLSAPLLSSNLISAGFLCWLVSLLAGNRSKLNDLGCGILGFCAVAARADAVLVLPLVSLLSVRGFSFKLLVSDVRLWVLGGSAVFALLCGSLLSEVQAARYEAFFEPLVATAFLFFGLGGVFLALVGIVGYLGVNGVRNRDFEKLALALALMIPLMFYGRILFSPRHLMTSALVILFFVCFEKGRFFLKKIRVARGGGLFHWAILFLMIAPMFVGVRLSSLQAGKLVVSMPTLYPTADGYWPMGCYHQFLVWLKNSDSKPIDHNQRVWDAWVQLDELPEKLGKVWVKSNGLVSLGTFRMKLLRGEEEEKHGFDSTFSDSRSLLKRVLGVDEDERIDRLSGGGAPEKVLSFGCQEEIVVLQNDKDTLPKGFENKYVLRQILRLEGGGNDYVLMPRDAKWGELRGGGRFLWFFFSLDEEKNDESEGGSGWRFRKVLGGEDAYLKANEAELWIARSALPSFFSLDNYEN